MKVEVSKKLADLYKKQHKNFDYAANEVLDNLDPDSFITCFQLVNAFELDGEKCEITLGDETTERIIADLEMNELDGETVELILWLGAVLPEV